MIDLKNSKKLRFHPYNRVRYNKLITSDRILRYFRIVPIIPHVPESEVYKSTLSGTCMTEKVAPSGTLNGDIFDGNGTYVVITVFRSRMEISLSY